MRKSLMLTDIGASDAIYCSRRAEEKKLEAIWIPEMNRRDSISILGAVAANTGKIQVAPGILNVYSRTPALIAMTLNTLQELSDGRIIAGLSSGNPDYIRDIHGLSYGQNIDRLRETIAIIRKAQSGDSFIGYKGKIFAINNWSPKFQNIKNIPIYIGAHNPNMLNFAGESGDGVILNLVSPENVVSAKERIHESARRHGRETGSVSISSILMIAIDNNDPHSAEKRVRNQIAFYLTRSRQIRKRFAKSKYAGEIANAENALARGRTNDVATGLSREFVKEIAIYGNKRDVEARLLEYENAGLDEAIFYVAGWMGDSRKFTDDLLESMR
ncbi:MAG: LLM class flavin-dependent oxidoreductase [Nitrososphaerales archaeon]